MYPAEILEEVKNYPGIDITWNDNAVNSQLIGIIGMGMTVLDGKAGVTLDYAKNGLPKQLLLEYCKYARNGILSEFMSNLAPFLMDLRAGNGGAYGSKTTTV